MRRMNLRKTLSAAVLIGGTIVAASALADQPRGGYGAGYGMGSGMMGGYGTGSGLDLTREQRSRIAGIQNDVRRKHWELMGKMQDEQAQMNEQYYSEQRDDAALSASYRKMSDLRHQMFDLSLSARKKIDAVRTQEQRQKQKRG